MVQHNACHLVGQQLRARCMTQSEVASTRLHSKSYRRSSKRTSGANVRAWRRHYVKNVGEDVCICVCYCIYIVEAFKKLFQVSEPSSPRTDLKL